MMLITIDSAVTKARNVIAVIKNVYPRQTESPIGQDYLIKYRWAYGHKGMNKH